MRAIKMKLEAKRVVAQYFIFFLAYSVIGWLYEVFLDVAVYQWGFNNRGVLYGPYCVIYGTGAVILIILLRKLKNKKIYLGKIPVTPVLVFLAIIVITTVLELIGSYVMESIYGIWMWDYQRFAFNFQGRIALNPSLRFGFGGMIFLYGLQPIFEKIAGCWSKQTLLVISSILAVIFLFDVICTFFF